MQLGPHIDALQVDLADVAAVGDEPTAAAARRLGTALRSAAGLRFLDVLSEAALELSSQLPSGHVDVRLAGQEVTLAYVEEQEPGGEQSAGDDGMTARITLRLPESLKTRIEAAAAVEGLSVNAWLVRALARSVSSPTVRGPGSRLTGFGQS